MKIGKKVNLTFVPMLVFVFCASIAVGGTVPAGKSIGLVSGGPRQGTLQTDNLAISYEYTLNQSQLSVSGKLKFADSLTMNYPGLQQFYLELLLVDANGEVIERKNAILKYGFNWGTDEASAASGFKAQMSVPPQARAMTFYYNGVTQAGVGGGEGISFWFDPSSGISK